MSVQPIHPEPEAEKEPIGLDSMTAGETAMAERQAAQSITTLGNDAYPQVGLIGALGWVLHRRKDPKITYQQYMNTHKLTEITKDLGIQVDEAEDEDEGKDDDGSTSSS